MSAFDEKVQGRNINDPILIFYDEQQSVNTNDSFSPSAQKPKLAVESWKRLNIPLKIVSGGTVSRQAIYMAHDKEYVDSVLDLRVDNGFGNRNPEVARALPFVLGSIVSATQVALASGSNTFSPTSGFHHAHHSGGMSFCTFNGLILAAMVARDAGAKKIGIVDCDMHRDDGTRDIMEKLKLNYIKEWSFGYEDINKENAEDWLWTLPDILLPFEGCDVVLYQAGADSALTDPLGGVLTDDQLSRRDRIVYETFQALKIPVTTCLAGGYETDVSGSIRPVLRRHDNTLIECWKVLAAQKARL